MLPSSLVQWPSIQCSFCTGSSSREATSSGRSEACTARSADRAARSAERMDANEAAASTSVPPAVASAETVPQSVMGARIVVIRRQPRPGGPAKGVRAAARRSPPGRRHPAGQRWSSPAPPPGAGVVHRAPDERGAAAGATVQHATGSAPAVERQPLRRPLRRPLVVAAVRTPRPSATAGRCPCGRRSRRPGSALRRPHGVRVPGPWRAGRTRRYAAPRARGRACRSPPHRHPFGPGPERNLTTRPEARPGPAAGCGRPVRQCTTLARGGVAVPGGRSGGMLG